MGNEIRTFLTGNVWLKKAMLIIIVSLMPVMAMAQGYAGGDGSEGNPYQVETWEHLDSVRVNLNAHFTLMNDLDENTTGYTDYVKGMEGGENVVNDGQGWEPIGTYEEPFTGFFDGGEYTISDLYIDRLGLQELQEVQDIENNNFIGTPPGVGLFGYVSTGLFTDVPEVNKTDHDVSFFDTGIKNLHLENVDVRGTIGVGAIVGINEGLLMNVSVSGEVKGLFIAGGITGANAGIITQSSSDADVLFDVDRLIELNDEGFEGDVPFFGIGGMGGLAGYNIGGIVLSNSGGNVGFTEEVITELEELAEGEDIVLDIGFFPIGYGGLVGINESELLGAVAVSYSTANVGGLFGTGGLIGLNGFEFFLKQKSFSPFSYNSSLEIPEIQSYIENLEPLEVRDTYATGTVNGLFSTGGLIGGNSGSVHNSYAVGMVGLFEEALEDMDGELPINPRKRAEEDPEFYEEFGLGGLIGEGFNFRPGKRFSDIENYRFSFRDFENSVQEFSDMFDTEEDPMPEFPVFNSFWDVQTSGIPVSAGGMGLNTQQMKTIFTYLEASWDFENLWAIEDGFGNADVVMDPSKSNGTFVSYPYFGVDASAPTQTPAPGLAELTDDRVTVPSATFTELDGSDFDFGSGETITILGLPANGRLILEILDDPDGSGEVEIGDVIQKENIENGDLSFESVLPSRSISIYAEEFFQAIQYENDDETVALFVDVAARSFSYSEPEGWYLFASPSIGETVDELLNGIRTEGFPGSTNPGESFPTVYTLDQEAYEWEAVSNIDQVLEQGQALLVYVFQDDLDELDRPFSELLLSNGPWLPLDGSFSFDIGYDPDQGPQGNSHFLIANPHPITVNICNSVSRSERVANNYYIWSPSENDGNGGYVNFLCNLQFNEQEIGPGLSGRPLSPLEGFWVRTTEENPSLEIQEEDYGSGFGLIVPVPVKEVEDEHGTLRPLTLSLEHNDRNYNGSAHILFSNYGSDDLDNYDATHLSSVGLAERYLFVFAVDEENRKFNLQSLPKLTQDERVIPLGIETTEPGNYTFSWFLPSDTPAGVSYYLRDTKTESLTELEDGGRYSFSLSESEVTLVEKSFNGEKNINAKSSLTTHRFELIATMNDLNTGIELPTDISLKQNYPNPFNPTTVIEYQLPQSAQVRLQVYDMSGRQVAELVNEQVSAGLHTINFDASNLSSGVYMYRLQAGSTMLTRKLTVVK